MTLAESQNQQGNHKFDLADLVSSLIILKAPNRAVDQIVEAMLAGNNPRNEITQISVVGNKWLYSVTPYYTRDIKSVEVLAARRGVRFFIKKIGAVFSVTATMPKTGKTVTSAAPLEAPAVIAAIAGLSYTGASVV